MPYILHSAKHLLDLIDEVLDLTRIETGNVGISLADLDSEPIVKEALAIVQTLAGERDIDVSLRYLCATCAVRADHKRLRQVLFNLLSNAIKYNGPGGEVSVTVGNEGASFIRIEVTDAGPGIPIERQGELFQPFNRLGAETSDVEGTGIGLSLCKHLVELMGGTIGFKPATGGGTTFWFRLPAAEGDVPDCDSNNATQSTNAAMVPYLHPNRTVLCIGDGPENLELLCQIAARVPGASVERGTAETLGSEPIDAIQPDALLVDLDSVVRLNPGFLQSPRTASGFAGTPIVAVASERHANELPAETMGAFFRFLVKPYGVRQLIEILETALGSSDENSSRSPEHQLERAETTEI